MKNTLLKLEQLLKTFGAYVKKVFVRINFRALALFVGLQVVVAIAAFVFFGLMPVKREAKIISENISAKPSPQGAEFVEKKNGADFENSLCRAPRGSS